MEICFISLVGHSFALAANVCLPPLVSIDANGPNRTLERSAANGRFEPIVSYAAYVIDVRFKFVAQTSMQ
jgi:hypothetical protein